MKKIKAFAIVSMLFGFILAGCNAGPTGGSNEETSSNSGEGGDDQVKVAMILKTLSSPFWTTMEEGIREEAEKLGVDWRKLYEVAKLGSGNSGALNRIAEKAIGGDYKGYTFSVSNTLKDLTYINDLLKDLPNAEQFSSLAKKFFQESVKKGNGDFLISELIDKEKY